MVDRHPNCIHPLCGCAGTANCKSDPMNTQLPCDVKVGATTFRKGVKLGTFVEAARRWHREAFPDFYTLTEEQKAANLALLQSCAAGVSLVDGQMKPLSDADDLSKGLAGAIAYQLTKRLVIDIGTARVAVDAALKDVKNG